MPLLGGRIVEQPDVGTVETANMKKSSHSALLPTLACAWCKGVIRVGAPKVSHGICRSCAAQWFGKLAPGRRRRARAA